MILTSREELAAELMVKDDSVKRVHNPFKRMEEESQHAGSEFQEG